MIRRRRDGIKPKCKRCRKVLCKFGAILLSPPKGEMVVKMHICTECYEEMLAWLRLRRRKKNRKSPKA